MNFPGNAAGLCAIFDAGRTWGAGRLKLKFMNAVQYRVARPTNRLNEVVRFYNEGLGLEILGRFEQHEGYDGVMLGLPDKTCHLEFTQHKDSPVLPAASKEHLLVLYFDQPEAYRSAKERLQLLGIRPVDPENPYWKEKSETYEDPDGWRVVLFDGVFCPEI